MGFGFFQHVFGEGKADLWISDLIKKPELSWATQTEAGNGNGGICVPGITGSLRWEKISGSTEPIPAQVSFQSCKNPGFSLKRDENTEQQGKIIWWRNCFGFFLVWKKRR